MLQQTILDGFRKSRMAVGLYRRARLAGAYATFFGDFLRFRAASDGRFALRWGDRLPCLRDRTAGTGFDAHYVYHTAWAARHLARIRPEHHVDLSSCLRFVTIASAFVPMTHYDWRPPHLSLSGLSTGRADLTALPFKDGSIPSLSCMHVVEHVGLGRYGDPLDARGDLKAMAELARVLAPGGRLLFCVPLGGRASIRFNAHRIYTYEQVIEAMSGLAPLEFSLIPDDGMESGMIENATPGQAGRQRYGCGCFLFAKK